MKIQYSNKIISILLLILVIGTFSSCKKKGSVTYPKSTNYGENIFNLTTGAVLIPGESYSFEANLTKNTTIVVRMTNSSIMPTDPTIQKPRWVYDFVKGWYPDNVINDAQEFKTQTIGNNDFKMVFIGTNGSCKMEVFLNGGLEPSFTKFFTW
jgi:hypothetical protein